MADEESQGIRQGLLARILADPVRLRRRARWAAAALTILAAVASDGLSGIVPGIVFPLTWLCLPFLAGMIGYGDAFFLGHGVGGRRVVVTGSGGVLVALFACVLLSTSGSDPTTWLRRTIRATGFGVLYGGLLMAMASMIALGLSRGLDYAGRQVQHLDDENW